MCKSRNHYRRMFYSSLANQKRLKNRLIELQRTTQPQEVSSNNSNTSPACIVQLKTCKRILKYANKISYNDFGYKKQTYRLTNHWNYSNTLSLAYSSKIRLFKTTTNKKSIDNAIIHHRNTIVKSKENNFTLPKGNKLQFKAFNNTIKQYKEAIGG